MQPNTLRYKAHVIFPMMHDTAQSDTTMSNRNHAHIPVLRDTLLSALCIRPDGTYIDVTYGRGGHSAAVLAQLGPQGRLFVIDKDIDAVTDATTRFENDARVHIRHGSFTEATRFLEHYGAIGRTDGIICDLGISSPQIDTPERGFSFRFDAALDMRMDTTTGDKAADWLMHAPRDAIYTVLKEYGEEPRAAKIADVLTDVRKTTPITGTKQLADIVCSVKHKRAGSRVHPATNVFQAIRIHVNNELEELDLFLPQIVNILAKGGRLAIISFHSLEDRRVKQFIRRLAKPPIQTRGLPITTPSFTPLLIDKGKFRPDFTECSANPRARSAVMRIAERTEHRR